MSTKTKRPPFEIETFDEVLRDRVPGFLIDDLLPERSVVMLYGKPKTGKTFVAMSMAFSCAIGAPFLGRKVRVGPVLYVHAEGGGGVPDRARALARHHGLETVGDGLRFVRRPVKFLEPEHFEYLQDVLRKERQAPTTIYLDTLARSILPADESSNADVNQYVERVEELRNEFGCTVVVLHHPGHGEGGRPRGASSFEGSVDVLMHLKANGCDDRLDLVCQYMKDGSPFDPIALRREVVHLGADDRGRSRSSCVIVESDHTPEGGASLCDIILDAVRKAPGITRKDLAIHLGRSDSTLSNHLPGLVRAGRITETGRPKQYRVTDAE